MSFRTPYQPIFAISQFICLLLLLSTLPALAQKRKQSVATTAEVYHSYLPESWKQGLKYRLIGPARGGRVTAVTGVPSAIHTFYMGSTGGGVWKTTDGGINWRNVSDRYFQVASIGAVEVAPSDENVVYVGTGSACPRGNVSIGKGIYKSTNAGDSWTFVGLEKSGSVGKIIIHPDDPDLVYAAVLGNPFAPNPDRGVFRSRDGGQSWEKVLFISDSTGVIDLAINPQNPRIMYAAGWRAERKSWTLIDGGPEGGIWRTTDGGDTWEKLSGGLPGGLLGRIGIAVSPANPNRIWAILEAQKETDGGLYRSDDGGDSWQRINRDHELRQRAWYYNHITADPLDENTVYVNNVSFLRSVDGGKSFSRISVPHGDNHGLWINPTNPAIMIQCNDGGANISYNGGKSWSTQNNQPTSEIYRVTVDNQFPYRVYGAQQDNTTISVPSRNPGGLNPEEHWRAVGGGESGHIAVDPRDPNIVYAGNYIGQITRLDMSKGHQRDIVAYPQMHDGQAPRNIRYRFQWNAPIRLSPHNPDILYHCSQFVHRSKDGGQTWEVISPDLTTNNDAYHDIPGGPIQHDHTGVELYTTIFAFEESPHEAGVLWAGSDDGLIHISRDNGASWQNITPPQMPKEGTINSIDLSAHGKGRALVAVYKYRENDFRPYIFLTDDYGKTWQLLTNGSNGIPADHFVRVVREDPNRKGLLYAGTEFGMYISFDAGKHWESFQGNLPVTPVTDLLVKDRDLVIATQGRSFWILDDLSPLYEMTSDLSQKSSHLFKIRDAYRTQLRNFWGQEVPQPAPNGALIYFYLPKAVKDSVQTLMTLSIIDPEGRVRRVFSTNPNKKKREEQLKIESGLNRFLWDLNYEEPDLQENAFFSLAYTGRMQGMIGTHRAELTVGNETLVQTFEVKKDPRWTVSDADLKAQHDLTVQVMELFNACHATIGNVRNLRKQIQDISAQTTQAGYSDQIKAQADKVVQQLSNLEKQLIQTQSESSQDPINYPPMLDDQMAYLYSIVNSQDARPNDGCYERYNDLTKAYDAYKAIFQKIVNQEIVLFNTLLEKENVPRVILKP